MNRLSVVTAAAVTSFMAWLPAMSVQAQVPPPEAVPVFPIAKPDDARTHLLESMHIAVKQKGAAPEIGGSKKARDRLLNGRNARERRMALRALEQLGKSLFYDMQPGSDGIQACASCHFHAGADTRSKNQLNPGLNRVKNTPASGQHAEVKGFHGVPANPDNTFQVGQPDHQLSQTNFPYVTEVDNPNASANRNDTTSSMGVFFTQFVQTDPNDDVDQGTAQEDTVFNTSSGLAGTVRRVEPRNTPTVINSVFFLDTFWDGRGRWTFNGRNPDGVTDPKARILVSKKKTGAIRQKKIALHNCGNCSQAVGPPLSGFESSFDGRDWPDIGEKLLRKDDLGERMLPLAKQTVHWNDSMLGKGNFDHKGYPSLVDATQKGLNPTYTYYYLIKKAFNRVYWQNASKRVVMRPNGTIYFDKARGAEKGTDDVVDETFSPATHRRYTQMEYNMPFFWGIAIAQYERRLISGRTPFDKWMEGNGGSVAGFGAQELRGLNIFVSKGKCINCHRGRDGSFSNATVQNKVDEGDVSVEPMRMGNVKPALYDTGFYNIGVTPTWEDLGRGGTDARGKPLGSARQSMFQRLKIARIPFKIKGHKRIRAVVVDDLLGGTLEVCPPAERTRDGFCKPNSKLNRDFRRVANDGAMKVPGLRNLKYTGPYMHNGSLATLMDVVDFYDRGGNFCGTNLRDLDPDIQPLGLSSNEKKDLVAFLLSLTDPGVGKKMAPFDHPELFVPDGGRDRDITNMMHIAAIGAAGMGSDLGSFLGLGPMTRSVSEGTIKDCSAAQTAAQVGAP